jgi:hypothetical protein
MDQQPGIEPLDETSETSGAEPAATFCKNCGASVTGPFCSSCGQSVDTDIPTVWQLIDEFIDGFLNVDSRVWRSIGKLLLRPGSLTRDYLAGRRASYVSPLRLYLASSLLFFLVQALAGGFVEPTEPPEEIRLEFEQDPDTARLDCSEAFESFMPGSPVQERLVAACERAAADDGVTLRDEFTNRIPLMIFLLIPVTAAALKLLYPLSRRRYVEHLFFLFHAHAVFFILAMAALLLGLLGALVPATRIATSPLSAAVWIYLPVYGYLALRTMYRQGRIVTVFKYFTLAVTYSVLMGFVFLGGFAWSALAA